MSSINVKCEGIEDAIKKLRNFQVVKAQAVKDILLETGFKIETQAKANCPVKTGRLRASISTNWAGSGKTRGKVGSKATAEDGIGQPVGPAGLAVVVGTNVTYGPHVEHGHARRSMFGMDIGGGFSAIVEGRPYLTPAYLSYEGEAEKRIKAVMKEDVK
jgi:hypothetical protein